MLTRTPSVGSAASPSSPHRRDTVAESDTTSGAAIETDVPEAAESGEALQGDANCHAATAAAVDPTVGFSLATQTRATATPAELPITGRQDAQLQHANILQKIDDECRQLSTKGQKLSEKQRLAVAHTLFRHCRERMLKTPVDSAVSFDATGIAEHTGTSHTDGGRRESMAELYAAAEDATMKLSTDALVDEGISALVQDPTSYRLVIFESTSSSPNTRNVVPIKAQQLDRQSILIRLLMSFLCAQPVGYDVFLHVGWVFPEAPSDSCVQPCRDGKQAELSMYNLDDKTLSALASRPTVVELLKQRRLMYIVNPAGSSRGVARLVFSMATEMQRMGSEVQSLQAAVAKQGTELQSALAEQHTELRGLHTAQVQQHTELRSLHTAVTELAKQGAELHSALAEQHTELKKAVGMAGLIAGLCGLGLLALIARNARR